MLKRFSPYWLWLLFALPALGMLLQLGGDDPRAMQHLLHPTGEFAARFLIVSLMATPLMMLFRTHRWPRALVKMRRYLGMAAFGYALLHMVFYVLTKGGLTQILAEASQFRIWTGWLAFVVFVPLAATSSDWAVRKLGTAWKPLQRFAYLAAIATLFHWAALKDWGGTGPALVHFTPLIALTAYRLWYWYLRPRPVRLA